MSSIIAMSNVVVPKVQEGNISTSDKTQQDAVAMDFAAILSGWLNQAYGQTQNNGLEDKGKDANLKSNSQTGVASIQTLVDVLQNTLLQADPTVQMLLTNIKGVKQQEITPLTQTVKLDSPLLPSIQATVTPEAFVEGITQKLKIQGGDPRSELATYRDVISQFLTDMSGDIELKAPSVVAKDISTDMQLKATLFSPQFIQTTPLVNNITVDPKSNQVDVTSPMIPSKDTIDTSQIEKGVPLNVTKKPSVLNNQEVSLLTAQSPIAESVTNQRVKLPVLNAYGIPTQPTKQEKVLPTVIQEQVVPSTPDMQAVATSIETRVNPTSLTASLAHSIEPKVTNKDIGVNYEVTPTEVATDISTVVGVIGTQETASQLKITNSSQVVLDTPIWNQVADEIMDKAYQARPHLKELDINLHPSELGQVKISLTWDNGQVHLKMMTSEAGTGQLLQSNFSQLRESLSQMGVQCGMMEMGLGNQTKDQQRHNNDEQPRHNRSYAEEDQRISVVDDTQFTSKVSKFEATNPTNRINVTA